MRSTPDDSNPYHRAGIARMPSFVLWGARPGVNGLIAAFGPPSEAQVEVRTSQPRFVPRGTFTRTWESVKCFAALGYDDSAQLPAVWTTVGNDTRRPFLVLSAMSKILSDWPGPSAIRCAAFECRNPGNGGFTLPGFHEQMSNAL